MEKYRKNVKVVTEKLSTTVKVSVVCAGVLRNQTYWIEHTMGSVGARVEGGARVKVSLRAPAWSFFQIYLLSLGRQSGGGSLCMVACTFAYFLSIRFFPEPNVFNGRWK